MSDRFHARLGEESSAWVREGIITEEQLDEGIAALDAALEIADAKISG